MKMTLLELVQDILNDMDSDEVNSILDTVESEQVSKIVRTAYYEIIDHLRVPFHEKFVTLESLADTDRPNYLRIPDDVVKIHTVKYRNSDTNTYTDITYLTPSEFLGKILQYDGDNAGTQVEVTDESGVQYFVRNDSHPRYWTTFDDTHLVFDSFDSSVDSTLQSSKALVWGQSYPEFLLEDDFVPSLEAHQFSLLLSEAKSTAFITLKQVANSKEEQRARRQRVRSVNDLHRHTASSYQGSPYARTRGR